VTEGLLLLGSAGAGFALGFFQVRREQR